MSQDEASQKEPTVGSSEVGRESAPVRITALAAGGDGIGRLADGRVVFVEGGLPGDRVELADLVVRKKMARARIGNLIESSPTRVEPRCSHFGTCGGCVWQHLQYDAQLEAKRAIVRDALERIGGFQFEQEIEIVGSPDPYGYRARARLVQSEDRLGYRERGSHSILGIDECPILTTTAQSALKALSQSVVSSAGDRATGEASDQRRKRRGAEEWIISAGSSGPALTEKADRRSNRKLERKSRDRQGRPKSVKRDDGVDGSGGAAFVTLEVLGERLRAGSGSFIQANALLWNVFAEEVLRQCTFGRDASNPTRFIELYAGIGFLTLPLARTGASGIVIESDRSALADLGANLASSGLAGQVEVLRGRVEDRGDLAARFADTDLLLTDPPRTGLDAKVRNAIAAAGPSRLVYVSCDPATLARDLRVFRDAGYVLKSVRALDLFPHTPHVEVVARLERVDSASA